MGLRVTKLFLIIFSFAFFNAMAFKIFLEVEHDLLLNDPWYLDNDCSVDQATGFFTMCNGLEDQDGEDYIISIAEDFWILMYYSFTSLTTVGFGDYAPKSDPERIFITINLLFGVSIFSYILGVFLDNIAVIQTLSENLDEGHELNHFFEVYKHLNGNNLDITVKTEIE